MTHPSRPRIQHPVIPRVSLSSSTIHEVGELARMLSQELDRVVEDGVVDLENGKLAFFVGHTESLWRCGTEFERKARRVHHNPSFDLEMTRFGRARTTDTYCVTLAILGTLASFEGRQREVSRVIEGKHFIRLLEVNVEKSQAYL